MDYLTVNLSASESFRNRPAAVLAPAVTRSVLRWGNLRDHVLGGKTHI